MNWYFRYLFIIGFFLGRRTNQWGGCGAGAQTCYFKLEGCRLDFHSGELGILPLCHMNAAEFSEKWERKCLDENEVC